MKNRKKGETTKTIIKYTVVGILIFSMIFTMFAVLISAVQSI